VTVLPFNHVEESRALLSQCADELAAIIIEPILGGAGPVPATPDYLQMLRDVSKEHGIVLIFDEMITLGVAPGGAQELFGVTPDMTTGGKTIAAGMPMAFYGGRSDIMDMTAFGEDHESPRVLHVGTYGSHPLSIQAGLAAISQQGPELFAHLHELGEYMRDRLRNYAADRAIPLQVSGIAHLWGCHWVERPVMDYATMMRADLQLATQLQTAMLNRGILTAFRRGIVSAAHTTQHIDQFIDALDDALIELGRVSR
jgi:glutamate-1-semialdehyde 2,1-aminomutase